MIVNIVNKTILQNARTLCAFVLACSLNACTTGHWATRPSPSSESTTPYLQGGREVSEKARFLGLSAAQADYKGMSSSGAPIYWQPLLMPLDDQLTLTDRDFVLGASDRFGAIDAALPQNGQCTLISSDSQSSANTALIESTIEISPADKTTENSVADAGTIFFIHDTASRSVRGFGFFDASGRARCQLPRGLWYVSVGFGESRTHKILSTQVEGSSVRLKQHLRAQLTIQANRETALQFGDLIRIGKRKRMTPVPQDGDGLPEVPLLVPDDLFHSVLAPSENSGVREYLTTSLLVNRFEFNLRLEPGEYYIGLWRHGEMYKCTEKLFVKAGEEAILACDPEMGLTRNPEISKGMSETDSSKRDLRVINFDATFLPARFIGNRFLRNWLAQGTISDLLTAHGEVTSQLLGQTREENLQGSLKFKLQPIMQTIGTDRQPDGPYVGDFRARSNSIVSSQPMSFVRVLSAQSGLDPEVVLSTVFSSEHYWQSIPMAGTSERALLEGAVPFAFKTSIRSNRSGLLRMDTAEVFVSNGARIEWLTPSPPTAGLPMRLGSQQRMRVRLTVPPGDTTEHFAMFVNGERRKHWRVQKSELKSNHKIIEIDEKNEERSDFLVSFASWSKAYLPEFMYGIRQLPAIAFTRVYCVDVNENNICDKQWKSSNESRTYQP